MSDLKYILQFSFESREDLAQIQTYTEITFGVNQKDIYEGYFKKGFTQLSKMPTIGHRHTELPDDVLIYPIEKHLVIYQILPSTSKIYIIRIVHQKVNLGEILGK
jgi:plasmid stabilization system protein ParE